MGYMKIVQYGNITEIYEYEKNLLNHKERHISQLTKNRQKKARAERKAKGLAIRSQRSIKRSQLAFYRLCHHNTCLATTVHFMTLTFAYDITYPKAIRHVQRFMERIKNTFPQIPLSYISVSELTEKGRYHFHLLVFNLSPETEKQERKTRNFQRLWQQGYLDIRYAPKITSGIAGYMAKYMAKSLGDSRYASHRGYTCSRNIEKISIAGSNLLFEYSPLIIPTEDIAKIETGAYNVPYMGTCKFKRVILNHEQ